MTPEQNQLLESARKAVTELRDYARATGMEHHRRDPLVLAIHAVIDAYEAGSEAPPLPPQQEKICECGHHFAWHVTTVLSTSSESRMYCAKCACIDFRPASVAPLPPAEAPNPLTREDYEQIAEGIDHFIVGDSEPLRELWQPYIDKLRLAASGAPPQQEKKDK